MNPLIQCRLEKVNLTYRDHLVCMARYYLATDLAGQLFVCGRLYNNFDEKATSLVFRVLEKDATGALLQEVIYSCSGIAGNGFFDLPEPLLVDPKTDSVDFVLEDAEFESLHYQRGCWEEKAPQSNLIDRPSCQPLSFSFPWVIPFLGCLLLFFLLLFYAFTVFAF